ncbi:MAG: hypothetical protein Q4F06_00430 [Eubacteriales bacterium]|nr:hypothetical protein [Eubacteriales bacterium]
MNNSPRDVFFLAIAQPGDNIINPYEHMIINDPVEFYQKWGWAATSLEFTIMSTKLLDYITDWKSYNDRYSVDGEHSFIQYSALFDMIDRKAVDSEKVSIELIRDCLEDYRCSDKSESMWYKKAFDIWVTRWTKTNNMLPERYNEYKSKVLKDGTNLRYLFGSHKFLLGLGTIDALKLELLEEPARITWNNYSDVPYDDLLLMRNKEYTGLKKSVFEQNNTNENKQKTAVA